MTKDEARVEALRRWRELPIMNRQTHKQAQAFAAAVASSLDFHTVANHQRLIEAWLIRDIEDLTAASQAFELRSSAPKPA